MANEKDFINWLVKKGCDCKQLECDHGNKGEISPYTYGCTKCGMDDGTAVRIHYMKKGWDAAIEFISQTKDN